MVKASIMMGIQEIEHKSNSSITRLSVKDLEELVGKHKIEVNLVIV